LDFIYSFEGISDLSSGFGKVYIVSQGERINPTILVWASESAGLAAEDAAKRLALGTPRGKAANRNFLNWREAYVYRPRHI